MHASYNHGIHSMHDIVCARWPNEYNHATCTWTLTIWTVVGYIGSDIIHSEELQGDLCLRSWVTPGSYTFIKLYDKYIRIMIIQVRFEPGTIIDKPLTALWQTCSEWFN